jgi:hypothetical protein
VVFTSCIFIFKDANLQVRRSALLLLLLLLLLCWMNACRCTGAVLLARWCAPHHACASHLVCSTPQVQQTPSFDNWQILTC